MSGIIECVPNFSEGRDKGIIDEIVSAISGQEGVKVLGVEPGEAANRTVVTFAGEPEAVVQAAFLGTKRAGELIDMRRHQGVHPRLGATDVLPLVPVSDISLEECALLARRLAQRIYSELGIPCYCYEAAALRPEFKNLAACRAGEYEALEEKLSDPRKRPDFGPPAITETALRSGATTVGAREFLIAVNFNLDTASAETAHEIAMDVREIGRPKRDPATGKVLKDSSGRTLRTPGSLRGCKAIGWYIEEYGIAQVSMNITDCLETPLHVAYEEVCRAAGARGQKVTGTEIIGLVPEHVLIEAGRHFIPNRRSVLEISRDHLIYLGMKHLHLNDLRPFDPNEKIIELALGTKEKYYFEDYYDLRP